MGKHRQKSVTMAMKIVGPRRTELVGAWYRTIEPEDIEGEFDFVVYGKLPTEMANMLVKGR